MGLKVRDQICSLPDLLYIQVLAIIRFWYEIYIYIYIVTSDVTLRNVTPLNIS